LLFVSRSVVLVDQGLLQCLIKLFQPLSFLLFWRLQGGRVHNGQVGNAVQQTNGVMEGSFVVVLIVAQIRDRFSLLGHPHNDLSGGFLTQDNNRSR
jgi:hypothetical protein